MILPGTYANGFAPRDGEPLFPELWRGCVGAWNPGLGPSGLRLYDWSGRGNHGTLTNMPAGTAWAATSGRHSLAFDGTNDYLNFGNVFNDVISGATARFTLAAWVRLTSEGNVAIFSKLGDGTHSENARQFIFSCNAGLLRGVWFGSLDGFAFRVIQVTSASIVNTGLRHVALTFDATIGTIANKLQLYIDGALQPITEAASAGSPIFIQTGTARVAIGAGIGVSSSVVSYPWSDRIDECALHNRLLTPNEIRLLASRRGIAYEMAPRSWSAQQIAAYRARYYSQLVGGGVI